MTRCPSVWIDSLAYWRHIHYTQIPLNVYFCGTDRKIQLFNCANAGFPAKQITWYISICNYTTHKKLGDIEIQKYYNDIFKLIWQNSLKIGSLNNCTVTTHNNFKKINIIVITYKVSTETNFTPKTIRYWITLLFFE